MSRKKAVPVIKEMVRKIVAETRPEKVILFGSYAWGRPHEWSDVDLFIVKKSREQRLDRQRGIRRLLYPYDYPPVDVLVYTPSEIKKRLSMGDFFIRDILAGGKTLYEKRQTAAF